MRKILIVAAWALLGVLACEPLEQETSDQKEQPQDKVCVAVRASKGTKSSMSVSETAVSNLNVYAYRGGQLEVEAYATEDEVELVLTRGAEYRVYALANCGEVHAPSSENELSTVSLTPSDMAMCFREGRSLTAGVSVSAVEIPLTRLFARYVVVLDKNLENCDYQITSVQVKQQAAAVRPFATASAAVATTDGDSATAADLAALNNGASAVFYVPENCQGVLLPSNSDPWSKIPANIPAEKRGLCSYLHIEGNWTTSGASADLSLNLMLGADNCRDFNVSRNTSTTITLSLTDAGTLRSSWKVDMSDLDDDRVLSFQNASYTVMQEAGWTEIPLTVSPADMSFNASMVSPDDPVMEAKVENGKVYVRGLYDGELKPTSILTVNSWDGKVSDSIELTLNYSYDPFENYTPSFPHYVGEYGFVQLTNVTPTDPVLVETDSWSATLTGSSGSGPNIEYHLDDFNHVEYYVLHNQRRIFIHFLARGGSHTYIQMTQHKTRTRHYLSAAINPSLNIVNSEVSEGGNRQYDAGRSLYYDSVFPLYLTDQQGARLDINDFRIPAQLLSYKNKTTSERDAFSEFLALYNAPTAQSGTRFGCVNESLISGDCANLSSNGNLAMAYVYGTDDYGTSNPSLPITVTLNMSNGDVLSATGRLIGKPAFPSQRYLGSCYNYQIAPSWKQKLTTPVDFTSDGAYTAPSQYHVTWSIVHVDGDDRSNPSSAYAAGSSDSYSSGAAMNGHTLSFTPFSSTNFPACGVLGLKGTMVSPHTGRSYSGYYTLSVILYVSIGCSVAFKLNRMDVSFYPFIENVVSANQSIWASCFPQEIRVVSDYNSNDYPIWSWRSLGSDVITIQGVSPPTTQSELCSTLAAHMSCYRYSFRMGGSDYTSLLLDSTATALSGIGTWTADGNHGYYRLLRQYDIWNFDEDKYNGLENYILEAAYDSFNIQ